MQSSEPRLPRPVVMHLFVLPNQKMVRLSYASIKTAKKFWHPTRLINAAQEKLQPWNSCPEYRRTETYYKTLHLVQPSTRPVLRYQGGGQVLASDIQPRKPYKRRRNRKRKAEYARERTVGSRLRHQQILGNDEPAIRPYLRVHPLYYEDAWAVRNDERNWKSYRKSQWKE